MADELLKDLGQVETLRETAVLDLIDPTYTNRTALTQTVAENLKKVAANINSFFDNRGRQIKQIDLDGDGNTADDVKALAAILSKKSSPDNSAAIAKAETELAKAQADLAKFPSYEPLDKFAIRDKAKLQRAIQKLDARITSLGGLSLVQKAEKESLKTLKASADDLSTYDNLIKQKASKDTIKVFTDAVKGSIDSSSLLEISRHSTVRFAFHNLSKKEATMEKYNILADLVTNGIDGTAGQEYTGTTGYERFRSIVSWYPLTAHKDLGATTIKDMLKTKFDGEDGKISAKAYDGYDTLWKANSNDAQFKQYTDFVKRNPNIAAEDYINQAELISRAVSADSLATAEKAIREPRSFDVGSVSQDIKAAYKQLVAAGTSAELINAYSDIVVNGVDGAKGLETNSQHSMTRAIFLMMATSNNGDLPTLRKNLKTSTLVALTKFYDDATKGNRPIPYEALGAYPPDGIGALITGNAQITDAKLMEYINWVYANPTKTGAEYTAKALEIRNRPAVTTR